MCRVWAFVDDRPASRNTLTALHAAVVWDRGIDLVEKVCSNDCHTQSTCLDQDQMFYFAGIIGSMVSY